MDRTTAIMQSTITRDLAQEFKTGTNLNKYKLSSIDLFLTGYSSPETVKIYRGDHREKEVTVGTGSFFRPEVIFEDDPVATMTTSSWSQGHDVYTFTPPANTMLDPNTPYWIVVKDNGNPWFMAAPGEDVTPAQGWTISDKYQYRSKYRWDEDGKRLTNTDPAFRTTNGSLTIRINRINKCGNRRAYHQRNSPDSSRPSPHLQPAYRTTTGFPHVQLPVDALLGGLEPPSRLTSAPTQTSTCSSWTTKAKGSGWV